VKFLLAKYRHPLFRGSGIFIVFAESSDGSPAASAREGSLFPYRVDPALPSGVRAAAKACGIDGIRMLTLRRNSGGRIAMSRGFKAIAIFRMGTASSREESLSDERAAAWASEIAVPGGDVSARDDESGP
jgi:hypothetical protein